MNAPSVPIRMGSIWRLLNAWDRAACALLILSALLWALRALGLSIPSSIPWGLLGVALGYLLIFRLIPWARAHLLWSLRNRLIVAYLFIAVVPILLLLAMLTLSFYFLYWHFGAYLLYRDLQKDVEQVASTADVAATSYAVEVASTGKSVDALSLTPRLTRLLASTQEDLPGLEIAVGSGEELLKRANDPRHRRFAGFVQSGDQLALRAVVERRISGQRLLVSASVPMTPALVQMLEPDLGPVEIELLGAAKVANPQGPVFRTGGRTFVRLRRIQAPGRAIPPAALFDYQVTGFARLNAVSASAVGDSGSDLPVIARFATRSSRLTERLLALVGQWGGPAITALTIVGAVFLVIEAGALVVGIVLTRTITHAVGDLYSATQYVGSGDLSHRVRIDQHDQLGALGESFNSMTASVSTLIEEQRQRQRLESELNIAREVQAQLFPKGSPTVPGIEVAAVCRPARIVSGDYYDLLPLAPSHLGIAVADISGKGISAALLMASLQAALRSQALLDGQSTGRTSEVVSRLNRHLYQSSSIERYATFFYGVYDAETRQLEYTNAGHPPPLYFSGSKVRRLGTGGMVLGLFEDCRYKQETVEIAPGDLLVVYSDGLVESENARGEEFGEKRLIETALLHRDAPAGELLHALVSAAEHWAATPERTDDMTIVVARF